MSTVKKPNPEYNPESYSPKDKPAILNVAEGIKNLLKNTYTVKTANDGNGVTAHMPEQWLYYWKSQE